MFRKLQHFLVFWFFQYPRIIKYRLISQHRDNVSGKPRLYQPLHCRAKGLIKFHANVRIGVEPSPLLYNTYAYIETRKKHATIEIGNNCWINNRFVAISEGDGIFIGDDCLIGSSVEIIDSDFHDLDPQKRMSGTPKTSKVVIENNVFIGNNVTILKGVFIGKNSVIANGSVVTTDVPENVIYGGNPARLLRKL